MPAKHIITGQHVSPEKLERAKEFRRHMTPVEAKLWQHLRADRLEGIHFRRQQVIDRYIADFYSHQTGLVVEVDGGVHLSDGRNDTCRNNTHRER